MGQHEWVAGQGPEALAFLPFALLTAPAGPISESGLRAFCLRWLVMR